MKEDERVKKGSFALAVLAAILLGLPGCGGPTGEPPEGTGTEGTSTDDPLDILGEDPYGVRNEGGFNVFYAVKEAYEVTKDGWVFWFIYNYDKTGDQSDIIPYMFYTFNLRRQFDDAYVRIETAQGPEGTAERFRVIPGTLSWDDGSEAQRRDMARVREILSPDRTPEELLALDPGDYEFEALDGEMFFGLIRKALTGEFLTEGTDLLMWEKVPFEMLTEPDFRDGYKFQVAYLCKSGNLRELFIDVLYPTGPGYADYVQLSDLVEDGTATPGQIELYKFIRSVIQRALEENRFSAGAEEYGDTVLDGVDLSRLAAFLTAVQDNEGYENYLFQPLFEPLQDPVRV